MADQLTELRDLLQNMEVAAYGKWHKLAGCTYTAKQAFADYAKAAAAAKTAANGARAKVQDLAANDTIYPAGRRKLIAEAIAKGRAEVSRELGKMKSSLALLEAELHRAALPRLKDASREQLGREEMRLLCDGSADPVAVLTELAQGDGELAATAVSSYAESLLRAKGIPKAKEAAAMIRGVASAAAVNSADPVRRAVGEARAGFVDLKKAHDITQNLSETALAEAEGTEVTL